MSANKLSFEHPRSVADDPDRLGLNFDTIGGELSLISHKISSLIEFSLRSRSTTEVGVSLVPTMTIASDSTKPESEPCVTTDVTYKEEDVDIYRSVWMVYGSYFDSSESKESLGIDWQIKVNRDNMKVYSSTVNSSTWSAIKAVTVMRAEPIDLLEVLVDINRMGDYDSMFNTHQVSVYLWSFCTALASHTYHS